MFKNDDDRYLQINDVSGADLAEMWGDIKLNYATYEKWICYHNYLDIPDAVLSKLGATLEDDSVEMRLAVGGINKSETSGVVQITEDNFNEFAILHAKRNPENGANSERIRRNFSRWGIFVMLVDNKISDYIVIFIGHPAQAEIFCVEASSIETGKKLIAFAAKYAFDNAKNEVLFMADEGTIPYDAALAIGFNITGFYKGFRVQ